MTCSQNDFTAGPMVAIMPPKPSKGLTAGSVLPGPGRWPALAGQAAGAEANKQFGGRGFAAPFRQIVP
ncbi:hypothetical protein BA190_28100 [Labrys sp. WJW]|uniref:hypothetical protein n=1 Tax=Labrys sp. WJW TaxID=1737983 RepID=UPI00082A4CE7|nr:hypothetical protein [Labrys sp. WJW]OCC01616.1 hypothetical protein BA190_28100 [Labrys sp. WJW]